MHKTIWFKIHWILGIFLGVFLFIVGITGAILSFEKELTKFINQDSFYVTAPLNQEKLTPKELLEKYQITNPKAKINSISVSTDASESSVINIAGSGEGREAKRGINIYINPYTAEVLPEVKGKAFFSLILDLHRRLMLGEVGKQIVAISTIALIILTISGIIIYWGRIKHSFFKSFTFKFKHKGRAFLSTMHSAVGMWVIPFYLLVALTGLFWSYQWYNTMLYKIAGVEKPQRQQAPQMQQGQKNEEASKSPKVEGQKTQKDAQARGESQRGGDNSAKFDDLQKAVNMFNIFVQKDYYTFTVKLPQKGTLYSFSYLDDKSKHFRESNNLELDINSWQLVKHERFENKPLNEQLMRSILPLHTGEYFGLIGQIGMFLASSLMALFVITGFMLFINRHKKKKAKIIKE
ncbi:PepSY-associated TM helix domain-containing protein [Arcobacter ellisii]|uniref:Sulfite reductase n=1 Tax=Arcobacter ellisii TaxID=913109 RepID=A0A347U6T0_9BACT|nr:PepSY-associated TM helix domain-containing protein [Arcobacter ellisii]AXX94558.1 sulfite reductase, flavoprotein component [Arcobacter ellisii]RXI28873.1 sulfite reductase [Arcobacter ellisii]